MGGTVGLLDLPNELLHKIISYEPIYLSDAALLTLSSIHPRLNAICIPIYFSNSRLTCSTSHTVLDVSCENDNRYDPLRALTIAHHISHIDVFDCRLIATQNHDSVRRALLEDFQRVSRLLDRLDHVGEVNLSVYSRIYSSGEMSRVRVLWLKEWAKAYGALLDKILEKSCHTLTLFHSSLFLKDLDHHFESPRATSNSKFGRLMSIFSISTSAGANPGEYVDEDQTDILASSIPNPSTLSKIQLRSLHIHSELILRPPCLYWLIAVLCATCSPSSVDRPSSQTLTSLHFHCIYFFGDVLRVPLSLIWPSVPLLKKLVFRKCYWLTPRVLAGFLGACPQLEELVLSGNYITGRWDLPTSRSTHLKLQTLVAPSPLVLYFLHLPMDGSSNLWSSFAPMFKHHTNSNPLPSLRNLVVLMPENLRVETTITQEFRALARIYDALRHTQARRDLESFTMHVELHTAAYLPMKAQLEVIEPRYTDKGWKTCMEVILPRQRIDLPQPLAAPDKLWINLKGPITHPYHRSTIVEWFGKLTGLKAVKVTSDTEINGIERAYWIGCNADEVGKQIEWLVGLLKESHPGRSVQVAYPPSDLDCPGRFPEIHLG